jgi:hypothetical protein
MASVLMKEFESEIKKINEPELAIIIESKKNWKVLEWLGIHSSRIFGLNKKPFFKVAEEVAAS